MTAEAFLDSLDHVAAAIAGDARDRDRERRYAPGHLAALGDIGFWALTVPPRFGGLGHGPEVLMQAIMRVAAADGSIGQIPQNHFAGVGRLLLTGTAAQQRRFLTPLAEGAFFGNATAEPGERPPGESATAIVAAGDAWALNGRKVYATGSMSAGVLSVLARDPEGRQVTVLVPRDAPGVTVNDDWDSFGQRTTGSGSVVFDDVLVDHGSILWTAGSPPDAYRQSCLVQLLHAAIDTGIAEGALGEAATLARKVHGARGSGAARFADDALGLAHLGELQIAVTAARRVTESAAAKLGRLDDRGLFDDSGLFDELLDTFYEVVQAKVVSTRAALQVTSGLFDVGGAASTRGGLGLDRYWRDARTHTLHDAVRWKPHSVGVWLADRQVADPWSLGAPLRPYTELRDPSEPPAEPRDDGPTTGGTR